MTGWEELALILRITASLSGQPEPEPIESVEPVIMEDDPRWDCRIHGNQVCGSGNGQGVPAGDYGVGGGWAEVGEPLVVLDIVMEVG